MAEAQRLRLVLVDDEPLARKTLRLLARRDREVAIVAECRNGEEAVAAVREHRPDMMFLDVQMPGLSGSSWRRKRSIGSRRRIITPVSTWRAAPISSANR